MAWPCSARSRASSPASVSWYGRQKVSRRQAMSAASGAWPRGHQLGVVRAGVHRRVLGRAIQVDHVARIGRHEQAGAEVGGKGVDAVEEPVGVFHRERALDEPWRHLRMEALADMRQAHEQRPRAAPQRGDRRFAGRHHGATSRPRCTTRRHGLRPNQ
jgi:hypothetical protein